MGEQLPLQSLDSQSPTDAEADKKAIEAWNNWGSPDTQDDSPKLAMTTEPKIMDGDRPAATAGQIVEADAYANKNYGDQPHEAEQPK